jgi:hypothetical protein
LAFFLNWFFIDILSTESTWHEENRGKDDSPPKNQRTRGEFNQSTQYPESFSHYEEVYDYQPLCYDMKLLHYDMSAQIFQIHIEN